MIEIISAVHQAIFYLAYRTTLSNGDLFYLLKKGMFYERVALISSGSSGLLDNPSLTRSGSSSLLMQYVRNVNPPIVFEKTLYPNL